MKVTEMSKRTTPLTHPSAPLRTPPAPPGTHPPHLGPIHPTRDQPAPPRTHPPDGSPTEVPRTLQIAHPPVSALGFPCRDWRLSALITRSWAGLRPRGAAPHPVRAAALRRPQVGRLRGPAGAVTGRKARPAPAVRPVLRGRPVSWFQTPAFSKSILPPDKCLTNRLQV